MAAPRYNPTSNQMVRVDTDNPAVQQIRTRVTAAQVNAGLTLLAAVPGFAYRMIDCALIAIGGAASGATDVRILGTRAAGSVALLVAAVAGLTQSALLRAGAANATLLADGASHTPLDANTAITIGKTGGSLTTATHIDVILTYALE
jgi:hypothetical protein